MRKCLYVITKSCLTLVGALYQRFCPTRLGGGVLGTSLALSLLLFILVEALPARHALVGGGIQVVACLANWQRTVAGRRGPLLRSGEPRIAGNAGHVETLLAVGAEGTVDTGGIQVQLFATWTLVPTLILKWPIVDEIFLSIQASQGLTFDMDVAVLVVWETGHMLQVNIPSSDWYLPWPQGTHFSATFSNRWPARQLSLQSSLEEKYYFKTSLPVTTAENYYLDFDPVVSVIEALPFLSGHLVQAVCDCCVEYWPSGHLTHSPLCSS